MKWLVLIGVLLAAGVLANKVIERKASFDALPEETQRKVEQAEHNEYASQGIVVYHDTARHVTCWRYHQHNAGGLSCLPDSQVTLAE